MPSPEADTAATIRTLRKRPLYPVGDASGVGVDYGTLEVDRLIPHRPPMRFVDAISAIDLTGRRIRASRTLEHSDPVFIGHFPSHPIYPGVLQVETMGQAALCLAGFLTKRTTLVAADSEPVDVRALKIIYAQYFEPLLPGDVLELHASILEEDGMTATAAGQIIKQGRIVSISLQEVYFVE